MNLDHMYIYAYGSLREEGVTLDRVFQLVNLNSNNHVFFLKHAEQCEVIGGMGLMYGIEFNTDTWENWQAKKALAKLERTTFTVAPVKRLPELVISNYRLPNLMGM